MLADTEKRILLFFFVLLSDVCPAQKVYAFSNKKASQHRMNSDRPRLLKINSRLREHAFLESSRAKNIVENPLVLVNEALKMVRQRRNALHSTKRTKHNTFLRRNRREVKYIGSTDNEHILDKRQIPRESTNRKKKFYASLGGFGKTGKTHRVEKRELEDIKQLTYRGDKTTFLDSGTFKNYKAERQLEKPQRRVKKDLDPLVSSS